MAEAEMEIEAPAGGEATEGAGAEGEAAAAPAAAVPLEDLSIEDALRIVLRKALANDGLRRGLHECVKALDRGAGRLCCLSRTCDKEEYTKLVEALCHESGVDIIVVDEGSDLAQWAGLAKYDAEGELRGKLPRCSCVVVTDFGEETRALDVVLEYVRQQRQS